MRRLVHMNGRVYDPSIARFLSPDVQVPFPELTQSYNRYSYVQNNPLSRVDPSGYGDKTAAERQREEENKTCADNPSCSVIKFGGERRSDDSNDDTVDASQQSSNDSGNGSSVNPESSNSNPSDNSEEGEEDEILSEETTDEEVAKVSQEVVREKTKTALEASGKTVYPDNSNSCPVYSVECQSTGLVTTDYEKQVKVCSVECTFTLQKGTLDQILNPKTSMIKRHYRTDNLNADGEPYIEKGSNSMGCFGQCFEAPAPGKYQPKMWFCRHPLN